MNVKATLGVLLLALSLGSCSFFGGDSPSEPVDGDENSTINSTDEEESVSQSSGGGPQGTGLSPKDLTLSFTNSSDSPYFVSPRRAKQRLGFLRSQKPTNKKAAIEWQIDQLVLMRLLGSRYNQLYSASKKTMDTKLATDINAKTPERLLLELANTAFRQGKVVLAEFYIRQIIAGKNPYWHSSAQTLQGLIYLKENKLPEAALEWQSALAKNPNNQGAATNLGLMALKYGDLKTARQRLSRAGNHWQARLGLAIAARQQKQFGKARTLCTQVLSEKQTSKTALLSCALVEADGFKNVAKANQLLDQALKLTGGSDRVNEKILATKRKLSRIKGK